MRLMRAFRAKLRKNKDMEFPKMCIRGKDADHPCRNITIENVTFNGKPLKTAEELHLQVNEYTENLIIR